MSLIKLTNASALFKGKPLLINPQYIVSVFEAELDGKPVTYVYADTKDSWQVEEDVNTVIWLIQNPTIAEQPKPKAPPTATVTKLKKAKKDV